MHLFLFYVSSDVHSTVVRHLHSLRRDFFCSLVESPPGAMRSYYCIMDPIPCAALRSVHFKVGHLNGFLCSQRNSILVVWGLSVSIIHIDYLDRHSSCSTYFNKCFLRLVGTGGTEKSRGLALEELLIQRGENRLSGIALSRRGKNVGISFSHLKNVLSTYYAPGTYCPRQCGRECVWEKYKDHCPRGAHRFNRRESSNFSI